MTRKKQVVVMSVKHIWPQSRCGIAIMAMRSVIEAIAAMAMVNAPVSSPMLSQSIRHSISTTIPAVQDIDTRAR